MIMKWCRQCLFICVFFWRCCQQLTPYNDEWQGDEWIINWKGYDRKWSWPNQRHRPGICMEQLRKPRKASVRTAGLPIEIWTSNLPNMRKWYTRHHDVRYLRAVGFQSTRPTRHANWQRMFIENMLFSVGHIFSEANLNHKLYNEIRQL
jgi:hypothetical protein